MSTARLYVDEDASEEAVVSALRRHGIDVMTVFDAGRERQSDAEQLRFAASLDRAIYSLIVRHFARLHQEFCKRGEEHAGIILIPRQRYGIGEKIRRLQQLLDGTNADALKNGLRFL